MDDDELYRQAKKQVRELRNFYSHLATYLVVNLVLFLIDLATSPGHFWFYWPLLGWGIAVALHALSVFGVRGLLGKEWQERKIQEIMARRRAASQRQTATDETQGNDTPSP